MSAEEIKWLVKSGGKIIGPFSEVEIIQKLLARSIVSIDECSLPMRRWRYMREEPTFSKTLEDIRREDLARKGDSTVTDTEVDDNSFDLTKTEVILDGVHDDLTDRFSNVIRDDRTPEAFYSPEKEQERIVAEASIPSEQLKSYAYEMDKRMAVDSVNSVRWLWAATFLVLIAVGGYTIHRQMSRSTTGGVGGAASNLIRIATSALSVGDRAVALDHYKSAYEIDPEIGLDMIPMGMLLIQSGEISRGVRLLTEAPAESNLDKARVQNGLGVAATRENEFETANDYFESANTELKSFYPSKVNKAYANFLQGDYEQATSQLEQILKSGFIRPSALLLVAESYIQRWVDENNELYLQRAQNLINLNFRKEMRFYQESRLILAYIHFLSKENDYVKRYIDEFLNIDPQHSELTRGDLYVFDEVVSWQRLGNWCLRLSDEFSPSPRLDALEGFCHYKIENRERALSLTKDAAVQAPNDNLVRTMYSFILMETGHSDRAIVELQEVVFNTPKSTIPYMLLTRLCMKTENTSCVDSSLGVLKNLDPNNLTLITAKAQQSLEKSHFTEVKNYVEKGLVLAGDYKPFLRLANELERQGISTR